jgi:hypothetical protein
MRHKKQSDLLKGSRNDDASGGCLPTDPLNKTAHKRFKQNESFLNTMFSGGYKVEKWALNSDSAFAVVLPICKENTDIHTQLKGLKYPIWASYFRNGHRVAFQYKINSASL